LDDRSAPVDEAATATVTDIKADETARFTVVPASPTSPHQHSHRQHPLLAATRPRQWLKNLLVFAAPAAAGGLTHIAVIGKSIAACLIFVAASAGAYLLNDVMDAESDRHHPQKRRRPVASGEVATSSALGWSALLVASSIIGASFLSGWVFTAIIVAYLAINASYSFGLKRVPVVELACISAGFVLRAVAGGAAIHVTISVWFVLVTSSAALLIAVGKRSAEKRLLGGEGARHRAVLDSYPDAYLRTLRMMAETTAVITYSLWAFERATHIASLHLGSPVVLFQLSIVPFVLGILALELAFESGAGSAPEELALKNRFLQICAVVCATLIAIPIYW